MSTSILKKKACSFTWRCHVLCIYKSFLANGGSVIPPWILDCGNSPRLMLLYSVRNHERRNLVYSHIFDQVVLSNKWQHSDSYCCTICIFAKYRQLFGNFSVTALSMETWASSILGDSEYYIVSF